MIHFDQLKFYHREGRPSPHYYDNTPMVYAYHGVKINGDDFAYKGKNKISFRDGVITKIKNEHDTFLCNYPYLLSAPDFIYINKIPLTLDQAVEIGVLSKEKYLYFKFSQ